MSFWKKLTLVCLIGAMVFTWYVVFQESREGLLVQVFDVGQGDSIFIQAENGNQILIDGGPGDAVLAQLGNVLPFYDRTLDMIVLTHPDADHLDGLVEVVKRYKPKVVLETGVLHDTAQYGEWRSYIESHGIPVIHAQAGEKFYVSEYLTMEVLSPFHGQEGEKPKQVNQTSVVLRMDYGETSFLFTGDIESKVERMLAMAQREAVDVDVLKVAHHGSKTSSTEEFLKAVTPDVALVSVGRNNRYGHPAPEVLDRFRNLGIPVKRTDMAGALTLQAFPDGTYVIR